ncbi:hypothetical protein RRG08_021928 [Elysia crispata]|uniref:Uncharacterized protein n=1 Tax=Elysia crispata TaxID=231223 RepID=A0AAE1DXG3_9GAST|nr:hypothetical protein RRG08_021928 [Elysia crispata]
MYQDIYVGKLLCPLEWPLLSQNSRGVGELDSATFIGWRPCASEWCGPIRREKSAPTQEQTSHALSKNRRLETSQPFTGEKMCKYHHQHSTPQPFLVRTRPLDLLNGNLAASKSSQRPHAICSVIYTPKKTANLGLAVIPHNTLEQIFSSHSRAIGQATGQTSCNKAILGLSLFATEFVTSTRYTVSWGMAYMFSKSDKMKSQMRESKPSRLPAILYQQELRSFEGEFEQKKKCVEKKSPEIKD